MNHPPIGAPLLILGCILLLAIAAVAVAMIVMEAVEFKRRRR